MQVINVNNFVVRGLSVRTKNANEVNASSAKIGKLWEKYFTLTAGKMKTDGLSYGVYYHYESDFTGEFNVLAGSDAIDVALPDLSTVTIVGGEYLVFSAQGDMPKAVIDAWGAVWSYFSADNCPHQRAYTTDFERYRGMDEVDVYISIK